MTKTDLESMYIEKDGIIFTPRYTFSDYNPETEEYEGLEITATAEEVYQEWINKKQIDICTEPTAEERIKQLEQDKKDLAANVYMLAEIIETLLEGVEDGQEGTTTEVTTD